MESAQLEPFRPLLLRANRALGTALVEHKLVAPDLLDEANGRLMELLKNGDLKQASLLSLLLFNTEQVKESALINYQVEQHELGLIELTTLNVERSVDPTLDLAACWATRTLPYDKQEEFVFLATNFYLSEPVRKYWQTHFEGSQLVWSVTSSATLTEAIERVEAKQHKKA